MMTPAKYAARFINGNPFKPSEWGDIGLPILRIAQLTGQEFDNYFDGEYDPRYEVHDGDLLFAWSATIDSFLWSRGDALLNQHIFKVVPFDGVSKNFLFYSLKHYSQIWAEIDAHGSTMRHIKKESLSNRIFLPDYDTQTAIAEFLDCETARIDQLIAKKERMLALLAEAKRSKAVQLVTRGIDTTVALAPTGMSCLPDAPSHWRVRRIASLFTEADERGEGGLPVLSVSINWGISDRELGDEDRHRMVSHIEDKAAYKRVRPDDLVYNMMRAWQGAFGVARLDGLVSPAYVVARPKEAIHSLYFESLLRTPIWIEEFRRASKGIADFRQRLYWEHFRQVCVVLPPLEEQIAIAECIAAQSLRLDQLATPIETSIARLGELRASLIAAAVTGQLDISNWRNKSATERRTDAIEAGTSV